MRNSLILSGVLLILAATGCMSGMYSSEFSVSEKKDGVKSYSIVDSLPKDECPATMPVTVECSSSDIQEDEHPGADALFVLSLGLIPGFTSQSMTYDVTVRTPLGAQSGNCTISAKRWMGWLALFLPYPGFADVRDGLAKLPNPDFESKVRNQLVSNLVSQFPNAEYERLATEWNSPQMRERRVREAKERADRKEYAEWQNSDDNVRGASLEDFFAKHKTGWRERAEQKKQIRLANEAKEREIARQKAAAAELRRQRGERIAEIASAYLEAIRAKYERGDKFICPFPRYKGKRELGNRQKPDWLKTWTGPRLGLSEEDKLAGEALLAEFGTKYLPNAYANYEKRKDAAAELQQVFNEEFPEPWAIKETDPKWNAFNKVLEKLAKARTEFFLCHDELCHYWLMLRLGVVSDAELAEADAQPLAVSLLPENVLRARYAWSNVEPMKAKITDFAAKYAPESSAVYQKLEREFKELDALLQEVAKQRQQMDDARFHRVHAAAVAKRNELAREMNALSLAFQTWSADHRFTVKSSEDVAKCDHAMALQLTHFVETLPGYIKDKGCGRVIPAGDMIAIPGGKFVMTRDDKKLAVSVSAFRMQRTEVTQLQWMIVMGNNPSRYVGPDRPVENVSWDDCQEFIKRVSAIDGVQYRLPKEAEWEYACRAGSTGNWGKRKNGEEGPLEVMGWYDDDSGRSGRGTYPVAQKDPNAWGLYDMHGNVWEWCADQYRSGSSYRVDRGGGWYDNADRCAAGYRHNDDPDDRYSSLGFRLAAPRD